MSLHDLTSPSTSTSNIINSSCTTDIKWIGGPFISSVSSPGQGQSHGQDDLGRSGVESGRNNSPPQLRLSKTIKGFIRYYIGSPQSVLSSGSGDPGTDQWEDGLFRFVKLRDARVEKEDIQRWIKAHSWILSEAYHRPPATNFNFPFPQNSPRNEMEEQLFGVGGGSFFLNEQHHSNNAPPPASTGTGTGNGTIGVDISPPTFEKSSSQQKLEQLQSVSTMVMTLNETLRAAGLEPLRAHADCLIPLINTISRVTKNVLKGSSRTEVLAQQVQLDSSSGSRGSDFVIRKQEETVTENSNDESDQGDVDRESDDDDISVIIPVVL